MKLLGPNAASGSQAELILITRYGGEQRSCTIETTIGAKAYRASATDFFEALRTLRKSLIPDGYDLWCYGSCINVWATGLARDMGDGSKAYYLDPQKGPTEKPIVVIFAEPPADAQLGTPDEQEKYWFRLVERSKCGVD